MLNKNIYKFRIIAAIIVFILAVAAILGIFYPIKIFDIQFLPALQRVFTDFSFAALIILLILLVITVFCGRIYCSLICPFGILQEITGFVKNKLLTEQIMMT